MKLRSALAAAALLTTGAAAHTAALRAQAVPAAPRTFTLKSGMRVTLAHTGTAKKAAIALVLQTGEIDEPSFGPGLAALTADILLQGTVARSPRQIEIETAGLGTQLDVRAGPVATTLTGDVETARIPRLLSLMADLVRHPLLDTAGFSRVRRRALAALDSALHNQSDLARQQWRAIIFPDGPFGHPYPIATTLGMLQLGHVRNVYDDNYSASRAHLYVSGLFDDAATERAIREIFSDWKGGMPPKPVSVHAVTIHELVAIDQPGAARSVTWIGLPVLDPADREFAKLEVADMLLAGHDSSRVALDIASLEGTPPRAASSIWLHSKSTYWVDAIDVRTANTGAALAALFRELAALKAEAPPEDEVNRARARVIAQFEARNSSRDGLIGVLQFMDEHSLGDGWRTEYVKRVKAVTREDVRTAIALNLDPTRMAIAIVGDRAAIEPQLSKLRPPLP